MAAQMESEARTEYVSIRVTPSEKLRLLKAARRTKYRGSISHMLRDVLAGTINDGRSTTDGSKLTTTA